MLVGGWLNLGLVTVQGIVLVPLYLSYIGSSLYGAWLGSGDLIAWLTLLDLGLGSLMVQRISASFARGDRASTAAYLSGGLLVLTAIGAIVVGVALPVALAVPGWMELSGPDAALLRSCFMVAALAGALSVVNHGAQSLALALQRPLVPMVATVASTAFGIVVIVILLYRGAGLWALALGLLARSALLLVANSIHAMAIFRREVGVAMRLRGDVFQDIASLSGPAIMAQLGGAAASRSEAALIAIFLRPELATVFVLTRRAAEIASMVLDRIGGAVFPGFSHLAAEDPARSIPVLREVLALFAAAATLLMALYLALNGSFVNLWVGSSFYGGHVLTLLIGLSTLATARSTLTCYLYGATGRIRESAWLTFLGSLVRLALMGGLLWAWGLPGLPAAGLIAAGVVSEVALRRLLREIQGPRLRSPFAEFHGPELLLLVAGAATGIFLSLRSWTTFTLALLGGLLVVAAGLLWLDPSVRSSVSRLREGRARRPVRG